MAKSKTGKKGIKNKKTSLLKLSNKKLNKLAKQGKLHKAVGNKTLVKLLKERTSAAKKHFNVEPFQDDVDKKPEENDVPLDEFLLQPGRDYSFLTELSECDEEQKGKRKRKKGNSDKDTGYSQVEGLYEKKRKMIDEGKMSNVEVKKLLPLKSKEKGIMHRSVEIEKPRADDDEEEEEHSGDDEEEEKEEEQEVEKPFIEKFLEEKISVEKAKKTILDLCASVIESGSEDIGKLNDAMSYLEDKHNVSIRKCAMENLYGVFKDVIPDYKIREVSETEKNQRMKKETKELFTFEECLLKNYKKYIGKLGEFASGHLFLEGKNSKENEKNLKLKKLFKRKSVEFLGDLLVSHSQFNYRNEIVVILVRLMLNHDNKTSDLACQAVRKMFTKDRIGDVTLELVRSICKIIKAKNFKVKPKVLDTFLSLKLKAVDQEDDGEKKASAKEMRKKNAALSRKERKRQKEMKYLEKELREAAAEDNKKLKKKLQTDIVSAVFFMYFKVLKLADRSSLISSALEGLAKFAHLINVSYFDDLFAALTKLVDGGDLSNRENLHCIETALTLLMGQGSAFNIDPFKFYTHLYKTLLSFNFKNLQADLPAALHCLDLMMNKRKKHISDQRCLAFVKRLSLSCLSLQAEGAVPVMAMIKDVINNYPKCDILLDSESVGNGLYQPEVDNPDHCCAQNATLYELHLLRSSYDKNVASYSNFLLHGLPREGQNKLPTHLVRTSSSGIFQTNVSQLSATLRSLEARPIASAQSVQTNKKSKKFWKNSNKKAAKKLAAAEKLVPELK